MAKLQALLHCETQQDIFYHLPDRGGLSGVTLVLFAAYVKKNDEPIRVLQISYMQGSFSLATLYITHQWVRAFLARKSLGAVPDGPKGFLVHSKCLFLTNPCSHVLCNYHTLGPPNEYLLPYRFASQPKDISER